MEQLISVIMFSIPGLLVYFWIQSYGLNPVVKHTPTELASITALFWVPTVFSVVIAYNLSFIIFDLIFKFININASSLNMIMIKKLSDIQSASTNILFFIFFFLLSVIFSNFIARLWIYLYDHHILKYINKYRLNRKLTKLSDTTTVWDAFLHKLNSDKEEPLVVEIYKLDKPDEVIAGSITKMSRPYEMERALVLEHTSEWMDFIENSKYVKEKSYIDLKSGIVVTKIKVQEEPPTTSPSSEEPEVVLEQGDQRNVAD